MTIIWKSCEECHDTAEIVQSDIWTWKDIINGYTCRHCKDETKNDNHLKREKT